jgi:transcriptional regulator with XRE-family HTH domain
MADVIKEARLNNNMSQAELSRRLNISQPMLSDIESGKKSAPADIIFRLPSVLDDARSTAVLAHECGNEFFNVPLLKNVDDNPKNVLEVLMTEMFEAGTSIQAIKNLLINKKPGSILSDELKEKVYVHEEQIADLYVALKMHFTSMDEAYGIKLKYVETRINSKLKRKEYV